MIIYYFVFSKYLYRIFIEGSDRVFAFRSHEDTITQEWINELKKHINLAGKRQSTLIVNPKSIFWRVSC